MAKTYGFGIIGTGMIGEFHAKAIGGLERGKLVAVYDLKAERAEQFGKKTGCRHYGDLDKFLSDKELDIVTIGTPSGVHMEPAVSAAEHGKHVICEKPLDVTLERIDRMIEAHAKAGTQLGGVFNSRFEPVNQALKQLVQQGRLGQITYAGGYVPWWRSQQYFDEGGWKGTRKFDGGGALMNQGAHTVDLLQWLVGQKVRQVTAFAATLAHKIEVEDVVSAALEFENGAIGTLFASTAMFPGLPSRVELGGTGGTVVSESTTLKTLKLAEEKLEDEELRKRFCGEAAASGSTDPKAISAVNHQRNFQAFMDALDARRVPEVDGQEARKAVQIILAVYESARLGRPVKL